MGWVNVNGIWRRVDYTSVPIRDRLVDRFNLQDYPVDPNAMLELENKVTPITSVDDLLKTSEVKTIYSADPGAVGYYSSDAVSVGERWTVLRYYMHRTVGATLTTSHIFKRDTSAGIQMLLHNWGPSSELAYAFVQPVTLEENDYLRFYVAAYNAGDETQLDVDVIVEDAY